jgi:coatomer protein complex subunit alpha (xenin)
MVTEGKFTEALQAFQSILRAVPLLVVDSRPEVDAAKQLVGVAKEYVTGLLCEIRRKVG